MSTCTFRVQPNESVVCTFPTADDLAKYSIKTINHYWSRFEQWNAKRMGNMTADTDDGGTQREMLWHGYIGAMADICSAVKDAEDLYQPPDADFIVAVTNKLVLLLVDYRDFLWELLSWRFETEINSGGCIATLDDYEGDQESFSQAYKDIVQASLTIAALQQLPAVSSHGPQLTHLRTNARSC